MPLEPGDERYLESARGYTALGMHSEANEELEKIDPFLRCLPEVLTVRLAVYQSAKHWELMQVVAKQLLRSDPHNPQWPISLAFATRRFESIEAAKPILLEAAVKHPEEPMIHFNLACYECQLGNLDAARKHLGRAFGLQPKCRAMALDDPDLESLWHIVTSL